MNKSVSQILFVIIALLCGNICSAQTLSRTVVSSGGGTATDGNTTIAFNIGEPVADLLINIAANQHLLVGFIQPDADLANTSTTNDISPQLVLYPNPAPGNIAKLDFKDVPDGSYNVDIVDAIGHVLYTKTVVYSKSNRINLDLNISNFKGGGYYVRVRNGSAQGKIKLIKL